jgi:hypothetical protein
VFCVLFFAFVIQKGHNTQIARQKSSFVATHVFIFAIRLQILMVYQELIKSLLFIKLDGLDTKGQKRSKSYCVDLESQGIRFGGFFVFVLKTAILLFNKQGVSQQACFRVQPSEFRL